MALNLSIKNSKPETAQETITPESPPEPVADSSAYSDAPAAATVEPDWSAAPLPVEETALQAVPEGGGGAILAQGGFIGYDAFHKGFCTAFEIGGHLGQLQTLVTAPQRESCPAASKALYDICLETPALQFLIKPGSLWVQRAFAIGSFAVPVALGCVGEIRVKAGRGLNKKPLNKDEAVNNAAAEPEMPAEHARPEQREDAA